MPPTSAEIEAADRLSRRRTRIFPAVAAIFLAQQAAYFAEPEAPVRLVDNVKIGAWLLLSIVLLLALATGGFWLKSKRVRALMDDDTARSNRARALGLAFLVTMTAAILLYGVNLYEPMSGQETIHLLVSIGIVTGLFRFVYLERRDLKE